MSEELGVDVVPGELLRVEFSDIDGERCEFHFYETTIVRLEPRLGPDHDRLQWIELRSLWDLDWATPDIPLANELAKMWSERGLN